MRAMKSIISIAVIILVLSCVQVYAQQTSSVEKHKKYEAKTNTQSKKERKKSEMQRVETVYSKQMAELPMDEVLDMAVMSYEVKIRSTKKKPTDKEVDDIKKSLKGKTRNELVKIYAKNQYENGVIPMSK